MNLQQFVTETLRQISLGVAEARGADQRIAPPIGLGDDDPKILRTLHDSRGVFLVDFDVAISASESSEKGGGGGITVLSVASVKGEAKRTIENSSVSRVKFSVPLSYM